MFNKAFYINGEWVTPHSKETAEVVNPATEQVIETVALADKKDVDRAVQAAKEAFPSWSETPLTKRIEYLNKIHEELKKELQPMRDLITEELGCAMQYADAVHVDSSLREIEEMVKIAEHFPFEEDIENARVQREPFGVVACLCPWNFPLNQIQRKITPALLAGNTVVVKPSIVTPLSGLLFAKIIDRANLPKGVFNLITGRGSDAGEWLAEHEDVQVVSFTGSTKVGIKLYEKAKHGIKKLILELGGKSPAILLPNGDVKTAVEQSLNSLYFNSGQTCSALSRLLIPAERADEVIRELIDFTEKTVVGDPKDPKTVVGPLSSKKQKEKVLKYIESGKKEGAKILMGGNAIERSGYFVEPTIFIDVKNDMTIAQEEIFGPVLCVIPYDSVDEAVKIANDTDYGLSAAVIGEKEQAYEIAKKIRAGNVRVNSAPRPTAAPFGGYKSSGIGRESGKYGLEEYLEVKAIFRDGEE